MHIAQRCFFRSAVMPQICHTVLFLPSRKREMPMKSSRRARAKQPARTKTTATTMNERAVGSNAKSGMNALDRRVNMGEKSRMISVWRPI